MSLLIHHSVGLEGKKRSHHVFGDVRGELCIKHVNLSSEVTRLCQAFRSIRPLNRKENHAIDQVLGKVGKYTILLERSNAMFPMIIDNIGRRDLHDGWHRLAIVWPSSPTVADIQSV